MSIASLSTISTSAFKGGRGLTGANSTSLVGRLNTIISKVNSMITNMNSGDFDVLAIGSGTGAYYGSSDSWFNVDGTNPPTLSKLRIQDQSDGSYGTITNSGGSLSVS